MDFVPLSIPIELCQPPLPPVCWCRTILATLVLMPEAAVNEDCGSVFWQDDVGADEEGTSCISPHLHFLSPSDGERAGFHLRSELGRDFGRNWNPDVEAEAVAHSMKE